MSKRPAEGTEKGVPSPGPMPATMVAKKPRLADPGQTYSCTTSEDLDVNILRFQNKKLSQRLASRQKVESDLRIRLEQLEKKQTSSEAIVYIISRYWNQLNEDLRILLQRFDAETSDENENKNESEATISFLSHLGNYDKEEVEETLQQRVESSTRMVGKILQAFDRVVQRNAKVTAALKLDQSQDVSGSQSASGDNHGSGKLEDSVLAANIELEKENKNMADLVTKLHEQQRILNLASAGCKDRVEQLEAANDDLKNRIDDMEFELNKLRNRELRLEENLHESREKLRDLQGEVLDNNGAGRSSKGGPLGPRDIVSHAKLDDLQKELEEQRDLAANRLQELEALNVQHKETLKQVEKLKMDLQCLPDTVVCETAEYKCLQSHFSVLYNESMQLKNQLEESRQQIQTSKTNHLRQIEHMESEELNMQKRLRTEVIQLEDNLAQVRREYEMLRLEFEQMLAANEQTGPINREMRHLITSLQNHNHQLKGEAQRYKRRLKEATHEISKLKHQLDVASQSKVPSLAASNSADPAVKVEPKLEASEQHHENRTPSSATVKTELLNDVSKPDPLVLGIKRESKSESTNSSGHPAPTTPVKLSQEGTSSLENSSHHAPPPHPHQLHHSNSTESKQVAVNSDRNEATIRDLKAQLKKAVEQYKEMKLLVDMHRSLPKETRDKVQLMAAERKYRAECEELRKQLSSAGGQPASGKASDVAQVGPDGRPVAGRRKLTEEETGRKLAKLEETVQCLQKSLAAQKQEDEALLNEMEVTGTAYEDMQEQNLRLIQQLREKDDANFKLMSERIKSQQIQKLLKEEKECLTEQVIALQAQVEAQNQVVRKLEEKERLLQNNLSTIEKELSLKQQAMELHKRKAIESAQSAADLKLHLEKYLSQLKEAQSTVADKTSALQEASFKTTRLQEDTIAMKRKYERAKKFELANTADEVLLEEIKELKMHLTCPSCKTRQKNAVLTKCFHVFCYECLKSRYESRQRKCPKCVQGFGLHDFHRLYLS
ncbi:E3 ubiquitin-protein ligase Bre1 [Halotydeus destructor]|nr:E3 ubiquitin-protein ligase Bre1 [Halotydeus destructor]